MKPVTALMINQYKMRDIDFMGYSFSHNNASYHHLIVPKRLNGPATVGNGAILNGDTSHPYLHLIENYDYDIFSLISSEMIDQNLKRRIDDENLRKIDDLLNNFEREYCGLSNGEGRQLIKEQFTIRMKR